VGRSLEIYLAERSDLDALLGALGWHRSDNESFALASRTWQAEIFSPTPVSILDVPAEAQALQAGIAWHVTGGVEGGEAGWKALSRAPRDIAADGHGVIVDESSAYSAGRRRRIRGGASSGETEFVRLSWWSNHPTMRELDGIGSFVEALEGVLPEALPRRWGEFEPPSKTIEARGTRGLAEDIVESFAETIISVPGALITRTSAPFSDFAVEVPKCLGEERRGQFGLTSFTIEVGGSILSQPGWPRQLSSAFRAVSLAVRPFYGEARMERGVTWNPLWGGRGGTDVRPVNPMFWYGLPRVAPQAMVVGPPYAAHWVDPSGEALGNEMILYDRTDWPELPSTVVPVAPEALLQEHDIRIKLLPEFGNGMTGDHPTRIPEVWPFGTSAT